MAFQLMMDVIHESNPENRIALGADVVKKPQMPARDMQNVLIWTVCTLVDAALSTMPNGGSARGYHELKTSLGA